MNLVQYFRLCISVVLSPGNLKDYLGNSFNTKKEAYNNTYFSCPIVFAKDGFSVSMQINNGNYCTSDKGYREYSLNWEEVEFGFPSMNEELMWEYSEIYDEEFEKIIGKSNFNVIGTVGRIPISIMEKVFEKHGGIDWDKTLSEENLKKI